MAASTAGVCFYVDGGRCKRLVNTSPCSAWLIRNIWDGWMLPYTLPPSDLEQIGAYLFGPRWQSALAHAVHRDPRLVRRWLAGDRQATRHTAELIEALAKGKHAERLRRPNTDFLMMVAGLSNAARKIRLLDKDLS